MTNRHLGEKYPITLVKYNPQWPILYQQEVHFLIAQLGPGLITRIEHFGSTAVPGLAAKPIIDILVEIASFDSVQQVIKPVLEAQSYIYLWRGDRPPGHAMFVKGYGPEGYLQGVQRCHLHLAPGNHPLWERLLFRDYLRKHQPEAQRYEKLKMSLAQRYRHDREAYTEGKTDFVQEIMAKARKYKTQSVNPQYWPPTD